MKRAVAWTTPLFVGFLAIALGCDSGGSSPPGGGFDIDGRVYNEKYKCSQALTGQAPVCIHPNVLARIQFTRVGPDVFEVRNVPDTGYVATGTFNGVQFDFTATYPNGDVETGSWGFTTSGNAFAGSSTYVASDASYTGQCHANGAIVPGVPGEPSAVGACP